MRFIPAVSAVQIRSPLFEKPLGLRFWGFFVTIFIIEEIQFKFVNEDVSRNRG